MTPRCYLFSTMNRPETTAIAIRDTLTRPQEAGDLRSIDTLHARQGRIGCGYHFLVQTDGTIDLCRKIQTVGSHSLGLDFTSVAIGVVGGVDPETGERTNTRSEEQERAIEELVSVLSDLFPNATLDDNPRI